MLHDVIREYIKSHGIKQNYLAEKLGVGDRTVTDMLNGNRKILAEEYYLLCKALGVPMSYFFELLGDIV